MDKIIISGDSYSYDMGTGSYSDYLKDYYKLDVVNLSWPGQSNKSILNEIYEQIQNGVTNSLFICQLTYLHRLGMFCNINQKKLEFQPFMVNVTPEIKNSKVIFDVDYENNHPAKHGGIQIKGIRNKKNSGFDDDTYDILRQFYKTYLKYMFDEKNEFNQLMLDIDILQKVINSTNNKILFIYWQEPIINKKELESRNFFNIDSEYSMLIWSTLNYMLDGKTSHLSNQGHKVISEEIIKKINNI